MIRLCRPSVLAAVLLSVLPAQTPEPGPPSEGNPAWSAFAADYRSAIDQHGVIGSSVLLLQQGRILGQAHHGFQDEGRKRCVSADTAFHWASITKTFTAVAILQLRDEKRLSLDDLVVHHLPELRQVHAPNGELSKLTIRHLLSHAGGLRGPTWPWGGQEEWHPFEPTRWEQLVAMFPYTRIEHEPGTRYSYSNPGIVLLGRIIEVHTGEDYETYVEKNILRPLGMRESYFDRAPRHLRRFRSHSYVLADGQRRELPFDFDTGVTVSNGGLNGPLRDMARWLAFLLGHDGEAVFSEVLARSSLEEMFRPVLPLDPSRPEAGSMGLGFFLERHHHLDFIAHSGGQNGFISHIYVCPVADMAYAIAFNTEASPTKPRPTPDTRRLDRELRDEIVRRFFLPAARQRAARPTSGAAEAARPVADRSAALENRPPALTAKAWVLADGASGDLIAGREATTPLKAASTAKMMCARVVLELARKEPRVLDETATISQAAASTTGSNASLKAGDLVSIRSLLYGLMLPSGNDAGVALAEHFGPRLRPDGDGSERTPRELFVDAMNREAARVGLVHTRYSSPYGDSAEEVPTTTAADLAKLAATALEDPTFAAIVRTREQEGSVRGADGSERTITWRNTNQLLAEEGCDGVKTGTNPAAGACLVASMRRGERHLIAVVLGSATPEARFAEARALLEWGFAQPAGSSP